MQQRRHVFVPSDDDVGGDDLAQWSRSALSSFDGGFNGGDIVGVAPGGRLR
jgi:hypothetical protein